MFRDSSTGTVPSCSQCSIAFSILNITTTPADSGTYIVTVTGGTGAAARSVNVTALVEGFTISASPASLSMQAGSGSTSIITLTSVSGFSGTVNLSKAVTGCGCLTSQLNSTSVVLASGGTKTVALTVNATSTTGDETITVTGTAPSISFSASTSVSVTSVDFTVNAVKSVLTMNAGFSNSTSVTLSSINGFTGTITLTATSNSTNLSVSVSASSVTLQATGTGSTASIVLTVNGTKTGNYLVTLTATSGSLTHRITITVKAVDFSITSTASMQVNVGSPASTPISLASLNGFAGTVTLTNSTSPSGIIASLSSRSVLLSSNGSNSVILTVFSATVTNYNLTIIGISGTLVHTIHIRVNVVDFTIIAGSVTPTSINAGSPGNSTITVTGLNGFAETVALSFSAPSGITCSLSATRLSLPPSPATSILSCSSSTAANYSVTVTGINGTLSRTTASILFHVVDFTIVTLPSSSVSLVVGQSSTTTSIHLGSLSFTGTVTLNVLISPTGPSASPALASLKLSPTGCACNSTVLNITAGQVAGIYTLNITATNGQLTHSVIITLSVQDFRILPSPSNVTVHVGTIGASTIAVSSLDGFSGTVTLSAAVSPSTGLTCNLSPTSVAVSTTTPNANSTLSCSGSAGAYTVTITGSSNGLVRTATVNYKVQDFTLSASPTSVTVFLGSSASSTITVTAFQGFTGTVDLTETVSPSIGLSCVLNPATFAFNTTATLRTSTLSCTDSALSGTFNVTVTGTGNGLWRSASVKYSVATGLNLSAKHRRVAGVAGSTGTATITVTYSPTFIGTVTLNDTISPSTGLSCSLSVTSFTATGNSTLSCSGVAGPYSVNVKGTNGQNTASTTVSYQVQDFTLSASPTTFTVNAAVAGSSTITITALNGFGGVVGLAFGISPAAGLTCTLTPASVSSSGTSSLSCSGNAGVYSVTVTGTSGTLSHSAAVTYTIQDFTIAAGPTSVTVLAGVFGTSTITVTALDGFAGVVNLTPNVSPATGLTCTLTPNSLTGSGTSTLSCGGSAGFYTVTVTGASGTLLHSATVTYTIQDFTVAASPTSLTVLAGTQGTSTITLSALQGFAGVVSLTSTINPASGITCGLTPTSVTGSGSSTLSCSGVSGGYTVTVTGTSGSLSHSITVTYAVQDFTIAASPTAVIVNAGAAGTSAFTITGLQSFSGVVSLTSSTSPATGLICTLTPTSVTSSGTSTLSCTGSAGSYTVTITGIIGTIAQSANADYTVEDFTIAASPTTVTVPAGVAGTSTVTVTAVNGFAQVVSLTLTIVPSAGLTCSLTPTSISGSGTSTLSCIGSAGSFTVTVTGTSGALSRSATVTYAVQDFAIAASPTSVTVFAGTAATSTITLTSFQGFSGVVSLTSTISPATGLTCTLTPTSVTGSGTSTLSCSGNAGSYAVTVTGSSSGLSHSATVTSTVQDFAIATSPTAVTLNAGTAGTSTVTITALQGFGGVITLTSSISPSAGLICTLTPTSLTVSGTSTLSCSGSTGTYTVTIAGTSGTLFHLATVTYTVQDFTVAATPTNLTTNAGVASTSTITVAPMNGFRGTVALASSISPATGLTCTLTPSSIVLGASQTSTLSCTGSAGTYTITVTGASGSLVHTATVIYAVQDFTISASPTCRSV